MVIPRGREGSLWETTILSLDVSGLWFQRRSLRGMAWPGSGLGGTKERDCGVFCLDADASIDKAGRWSSTTRLETRTKEFTECASVLVTETSQRGMKVAARERGESLLFSLQRGTVLIFCERDLT